MTESQKEEIAHKMVMTQFLFAKRLAKVLIGGEECVELEAWTLEKTIQCLKELKNLVKKDKIFVIFLL